MAEETQEFKKFVEIRNVGKAPVYLNLSDDPLEDIILPAKGKLTKKLTVSQINKLKKIDSVQYK